MPILFINGTNDAAYPLDSYMKSYDAVSGTRQIRITVNMPHGHPPGWAPQEIGLFIDHHLLGKAALPIFGEPEVRDGQIVVRCHGSTTLREAVLHHTSDTAQVNKRTWQSIPATIAGNTTAANTITASAPPAGTTAWFLTITDERQAIVSTRVTILDKSGP
jgi:PhoPQ-activated pathogenicity-related protein